MRVYFKMPEDENEFPYYQVDVGDGETIKFEKHTEALQMMKSKVNGEYYDETYDVKVKMQGSEIVSMEFKGIMGMYEEQYREAFKGKMEKEPWKTYQVEEELV